MSSSAPSDASVQPRPDPPPPAAGSTSLRHLLSSMNPRLSPETYIWLTVPPSTAADDPSGLAQLVGRATFIFQESEGTTVVLPRSALGASARCAATFPSRMITLDVHSSLEAVGFVAAVAGRLVRDVRCAVNPVSGYFHDHLFVPEDRVQACMESLRGLAEEARSGRLEL